MANCLPRAACVSRTCEESLWLTCFHVYRSGKLNAKHRELVELQKQAQARLAKSRERFQDGMRDAREVRGDLEWTQKKVS